MSNLHNDRYDEIKDLIKKSKMIVEQSGQINVAKDVESRLQQDQEYETANTGIEDGDDIETSPRDKQQKYRISGGILALHGKDRNDLDITSDEKLAFQETMDEFVEEVSDLVDFDRLNVYESNVDWSGKIIDFDLNFYFSIGENNGVYLNGEMIKVDENFTQLVSKIQVYYEKFKSRWAKVLASRKKTQIGQDEE